MQILIIKNFFKLGLFKYSEELLIFIGSIVISRVLGPSEYGVVAIVNVFYGFLSRFADIGLTAFVIREKESQELLIAVQFFFLILGGILGTLLLLLAFPVALFYTSDVFAPCVVYAAIVFVQSLPRASSAALLKDHHFGFVAKTGVISTIITLGVTIVLAFLGFSYWSLILPQFFPPLLSLYLYRKRIIIPFKIPELSQLKAIFNQCKSLIKNLTIFAALNYWARNTDNFLIGKIYGKTQLGLYNRAYSFSNLPVAMIGNVFSRVLLPIFQKNCDDTDYVHRQYKLLLKLLTSVIVIPFTILFLFSKDVVLILWGKNWLEVSQYLPLLSILMLVFIINTTVNEMLIFLKKDKYIVVSALITGLSTIASLGIGAFISIKVMIYLYVITVLMVNSLVVIYIGFYKAFNFSFNEITEVWLCNWLTALSLVLLDMFNLHRFQLIPLAVLTGVSVFRLISYVKQVHKEMNNSECHES